MVNARDFHATHVFFALILLLLKIYFVPVHCEMQLTVCTCNLWNIMFSWEIRMLHIANMVIEVGCEVLVLQEVRIHKDNSWSQAHRLKQLLPHFRWLVIWEASPVTKPPSSYWDGWEKEGLAILSQWPIGPAWAQQLSKSQRSDTSQRIALHVPIIVDESLRLNIIVVHFSYDRWQQCQNAADVLNFIARRNLSDVIIAGDFNTYPDFEYPTRMFTGTNTLSAMQSMCQANQKTLAPPLQFHDAWEATHGADNPGFTFSNMPVPGPISRPDRIFMSGDLNVTHTSLHGNGVQYAIKRKYDILLHRLWVVIHTAKAAAQFYSGYPCLQDCGPNGVCRCGVCIKGHYAARDADIAVTHHTQCAIPNCAECSPMVFLIFTVFAVVMGLLFFMAGFTAVKVMVVTSRFKQSTTLQFLGCTCCLCNPLIITSSTVTSRSRLGRCMRCLGFGRLPPALLLFLCLSLFGFGILAGLYIFEDSLNTVTDLMEEELFPSDHLMLKAVIIQNPRRLIR